MKKLILTSAAVLTSLVMFGQTYENPVLVSNEDDANQMEWFTLEDDYQEIGTTIRMIGYVEDIEKYTEELLNFFEEDYYHPELIISGYPTQREWAINDENGDKLLLKVHQYEDVYSEIIVEKYTAEEWYIIESYN
jgi:hypothetical protein